MFRNIIANFHSTRILPKCFSTAVSKSPLAVLRKKTGYSIGNCKKALELNNNDIKLAEKWLQDEAQKQGWAKATKLQGRSANQGLIGLHLQKKCAALVEVGCETDFVARNDQFKDLVKIVANTCVKEFTNRQRTENSQLTKFEVSASDLSELPLDQKKLSDRVVLTIANLGENIVLKRGTVWLTGEDIELGGAIHPTQPVNKTHVGSFGALLAMRNKGKVKDTSSLGNQLGLHVIGMNPLVLNRVITPEETQLKRDEEKHLKEDKIESLEKNEEISSDDEAEVQEEKDEPALLLQKFIFNEDLTVKEYLDENELEIIDYARFECGEKETESQ